MLNGNTDPATDHIEGTQRLKVIELGCGCGIVGRHFAQIVPKCDVLLTDASPIDVRNSLPSEAMENKASQLRFAKLDWDAAAEEQATETANDLDQPELREPWDMVLISDCTYNWDAVPALVRTINWLKDRRNKHIVVVVASKKRHDDESVRLPFTLSPNA